MTVPLVPRIVILGGGYAGATLAMELDAKLEKRTTLYHCMGSLRGLVEPEFANKLWISYDNMFKHKEQRDIIQGDIKSLYPRKVVLQDEQVVDFDYCVIATGSSQGALFKPHETTREKGLAENQRIADAIRSAQSVLIVGAGVVGVELAGEVKTDYPDKKVTLVSSSDRILDRNTSVSDKLRSKLLKKMQDVGVECIWNERIDLTPQQKQLGFHLEQCEYASAKDASNKYTADVGLFSIGNHCYNSEFLASLLEEERVDPKLVWTEEKRIRVLKTGQLPIASLRHIFALGDVSTMDQGTYAYLIPGQASIIAKNISTLVHRKNPDQTVSLTEYKGGFEACVVTVGRKDGAMQTPLGVFGGFMVKLIKCKDLFVGRYHKDMRVAE